MSKKNLFLNILLISILGIKYLRHATANLNNREATKTDLFTKNSANDYKKQCDINTDIKIQIAFLFNQQISSFFVQNEDCSKQFLNTYKLTGSCQKYADIDIQDQLQFRICGPNINSSEFYKIKYSNFKLGDRKSY